MMRMKTKLTGMSPPTANGVAGGEAAAVEWEMRPGGMLVQKRVDSNQNATAPPTIRVRVKYGSVHHEIYISPQATFGEVKKKLTVPTGVHHEDQKLFFKDKERDSKAFLDISGVKDKSKLVLKEDPISYEKRMLETRRNAKIEKAAKSIANISLEVDRLASQVSALESVISKGGIVTEKEILNLVELLMNELIKLDAVVADGDAKLQLKIQVERVQKYVETLDMIKIKASTPASNRTRQSPIPIQPGRANPNNGARSLQPPRKPTLGTVVTTQWETFDSTPALNNPVALPTPLIPLSPTRTTQPPLTSNLKFSWDLL